MSVTTRGSGDDSQGRYAGHEHGGEEPTISFAAGASSGQCPVCGSDLAPDQRYCVECGNRRGAARFALSPSAAVAGGAAAGGAGAAVRTSRSWTSSATLLVGIAVLLLAIGVGFLIGHSGSTSGKNPGIHVVVNSGGGGAGSAGTAAASGNTGASSSGGSGTSGKVTAKSSKANASAKTIAKHTGINKAVLKSLPASSSGVSKAAATAPTVKPGGSCTAGTPGCTGGKETGNFFGG